ncbi:MAG: hypothetical protein KGD67_10815 [Candidatus Lokiarchaeota archaeon]|nr:hypothetical protein [Candidatus Lokiarchaeota archaeon]
MNSENLLRTNGFPIYVETTYASDVRQTICPDKVIHVGDGTQFFEFFVGQTGLTEDVVEQKRSKIIF